MVLLASWIPTRSPVKEYNQAVVRKLNVSQNCGVNSVSRRGRKFQEIESEVLFDRNQSLLICKELSLVEHPKEKCLKNKLPRKEKC
jgi:hypothetical protein